MPHPATSSFVTWKALLTLRNHIADKDVTCSQWKEVTVSRMYMASEFTFSKQDKWGEKSLDDLPSRGSSFFKESACNAGNTGDVRSIPGSGRSPGEGNGNSLQYSCLKNIMDRGAWQGVHGVAKSLTWLRDNNFTSLCADQLIRNEFELGWWGVRGAGGVTCQNLLSWLRLTNRRETTLH